MEVSVVLSTEIGFSCTIVSSFLVSPHDGSWTNCVPLSNLPPWIQHHKVLGANAKYRRKYKLYLNDTDFCNVCRASVNKKVGFFCKKGKTVSIIPLTSAQVCVIQTQ